MFFYHDIFIKDLKTVRSCKERRMLKFHSAKFRRRAHGILQGLSSLYACFQSQSGTQALASTVKTEAIAGQGAARHPQPQARVSSISCSLTPVDITNIRLVIRHLGHFLAHSKKGQKKLTCPHPPEKGVSASRSSALSCLPSPSGPEGVNCCRPSLLTTVPTDCEQRLSPDQGLSSPGTYIVPAPKVYSLKSSSCIFIRMKYRALCSVQGFINDVQSGAGCSAYLHIKQLSEETFLLLLQGINQFKASSHHLYSFQLSLLLLK